MRLTIGLISAALIAVSVPTAALAAPEATVEQSAGGIGIGLADAPGQAYIIETLAPGAQAVRTVRVFNDSVARQTVTMSVDAAAAEGGFAILPDGATNALTGWTSLGSPTVTLGPGEHAEVPVTVTVPIDAPDTAQRAVVWASVDGARQGVRMYVDVAGDNGPAADFTVGEPTGHRRADGTAVVRAQVTSTGGHGAEITGSVDLVGPGGAVIKAVPATARVLGAGESAEIEFVVPGGAAVAAGPWAATVHLANGYHRHDSSGQVTFPSTGGGGTDTGSGSLGSLGSLGF